MCDFRVECGGVNTHQRTGTLELGGDGGSGMARKLYATPLLLEDRNMQETLRTIPRDIGSRARTIYPGP